MPFSHSSQLLPIGNAALACDYDDDGDERKKLEKNDKPACTIKIAA